MPLQLYHYTTPTGLMGIINSNAVWASDYRFMNDSAEFMYGISIFDKLLKSEKLGLRDAVPAEFFELIDRFRSQFFEPKFRSGQFISLFIASFSEAPDLLSQWRGYNGGFGYSLGINAQWLAENASEQGFIMHPVLYDPEIQQKALRDKFTLLSKLFKENYECGDSLKIFSVWWKVILDVIAALKHPSFSEERERRAIKITTSWPVNILTRAYAGGLVPYLEMSLSKFNSRNRLNHPNNKGFERLIVGPALKETQLFATDALLSSKKMRFQIEKSSIPYVAI